MSDSFFKEDKVQNATSLMDLVRKLWPYFMQQKGLFFITCASVLLLALMGRLSPTLLGYAIDNGIVTKDTKVIVIATAVYLLVEVLQTYLMFVHQYLFNKIGNRTLFKIRDRVIEHVQHLPVPFFDKNPTGRIVTRVTNDVVSMGELFTQGIIIVFSSFFSMIAIVIAMYTISWKLATVTLLIAPPLIWLSFKLSNQIRDVLRDSKKKLAVINAFVAENINGMKVLQLYNRLDHNRKKFEVLSHEYRDVQLRSVELYARLWPTVNFFNAISVAAALYYGGFLSKSSALSTGALVAFILHTRDFIHPLRVILEKYQLFQNSLSGAERIFTLLDEPEETRQSGLIPNHRLQGRIEFKGLKFRYGPELPYVLKGLDISIEPGESVALIGRTGSGKSTVISLLQRFYDYQEGEILIDQLPLRQLSRQEVRRRIGVVQQDTFMFRGTIASNISLNDPTITREQIERAAELACCGPLLRRHKGGLDAVVEERGANLSHGERQLIAFARILAFDPDILILDEATANIDSENEFLIQQATRKVTKGRTSIIIAHRLSTVLDCDRIIKLDQGLVAETFTQEDIRRGHKIDAHDIEDNAPVPVAGPLNELSNDEGAPA